MNNFSNTYVVARTFKDFALSYPVIWWWQALLLRNVSLYWDHVQDCYCREVKNIMCVDDGVFYTPLPGQLVSYQQIIKVVR